MKTTISLTEATVYLQREFEKARPPDCKTCTYPKPFWGPAVGIGTGYWYLKMPPPCSEKCLAVIAQLWAKFTTEHEIEHRPYDTRPAVFTRRSLAKATSK